MKHRVILDCDNTFGKPYREIDDGLLILYLLGREDIELLGITNTFGNGSLRDVSACTVNMLELLGRTDLPRFDGEPYRGQNPAIALTAAGENRYANEIDRRPQPTPAAEYLAGMVRDHPGQITIIAAGPVGNLLDASKLYPGFFSDVRNIVSMGGYTEDLFIDGHPCRELNLSCNPEASHAMLHSGAGLVVFNGHVCLDAPCTREDIDGIGFWPREVMEQISYWLERNAQIFGTQRFFLWDLLPAVYLSHPGLFDDNRVRINPTVESLARGMLMPSAGSGTQIVMPTRILDRGAFNELIFSAWRHHAESWKTLKPGLAWRT